MLNKTFKLFSLALIYLLTGCNQLPKPDASIVVLTNGEALAKDASIYAEMFDVSQDEALSRLELQSEIGKLEITLTTQEPDTFGGLWINNDPEYSVTVAMTDNLNVAKEYTDKFRFGDIVNVIQRAKSLKQLEAEQQQTIAVLNNLGIESESEINVFQNRVDVLVLNKTEVNSVSRIETNAGVLPAGLNIIEVSGFSTDAANAYAGNRITNSGAFCTSGYSVFDSRNLYGITTAGHCAEPLSYGSISMPRVAEWWSGARDLQWHRSEPDDILFKPWARDNEPTSGGTNYYREIYAVGNRPDQVIGSLYCKYGVSTGYTCGTLQSKSFNPADPVYNSPRNNSATFMRLNRSGSTIITRGGDSGGPVYNGHKALGLTKGGWWPDSPVGCPPDYCGDMIYMAINYVTDVGLRIYTAPR